MYLIFTQVNDGKPSTKAKWAVFSRFSEDRPEIYCLSGKGTEVEPLASLHQTKFEERYGLPGSGYPRCGAVDDAAWEGVKVRAWASKELGDSLILSLEKPEQGNPSWVLLLSKADGFWILLDKKPGEGTCYFDRGELSDIRKIQLQSMEQK